MNTRFFKGAKGVIAQLRQAREDYGKGTRVGIIKAALLLQRHSMQVVPVDTGLLRSTARTDVQGEGYYTSANVSYSTHYATWVHENLDARHKPGQFAKYLEYPARLLQPEFIRIIREEARRYRSPSRQ